MEFARRLGFLPSGRLPTQEPITEAEKWQEAYLGKSIFQQDIYTATLACCDDRSKKVYVFMVNDPISGISIEIPLTDHTPEYILAEEAYNTTFFGEVVPKKYRDFATGEFTRDQLIAFLNRKTSQVPPEEVSKWFETTFGVEHLKRYGPVYIGSHGGVDTYGYDHYATIASCSREDRIKGATVEAVAHYARVIQRSLTHLSVEPLPVDTYLQDLQSALKFLPKNWDKRI